MQLTISNRQRGSSFSSTRCNAHQNAGRQEAGIRLCEGQPKSNSKIQCVTCEIHWPPSIFVDEWHPEQIADPLKERSRSEEICRLGYCTSQTRLAGIREEIRCSFYNGDSRPSCKEVTHEHGKTNQCRHVVLLPLAPDICISTTSSWVLEGHF